MNQPHKKFNSDPQIIRVSDELVDAKKFCNEVEHLAQCNGVKFKYNKNVKQLLTKDDRVVGFVTYDNTVVSADVVVLCCALWTTCFKEIKSNLIITPMRGASIDLYG